MEMNTTDAFCYCNSYATYTIINKYIYKSVVFNYLFIVNVFNTKDIYTNI